MRVTIKAESVEKGILEAFVLRSSLVSSLFAEGHDFLVPEAFAVPLIIIPVLQYRGLLPPLSPLTLRPALHRS